jgi:undecaprenyl-diphosphatase
MDARLFRWVNQLAERTGWAHGAFTGYAKYGIGLFAVLLAVAYLEARKLGDLRALASSVWAGGAALCAVGLGQVIGNSIDRARPYEAMTGIYVLVDKTKDFSFPSDHATAVGAVAVGLLFANRRIGIVAAVAAVVMAFTRVYVGAHYPSDVVAGLALGAGIAVLGHVAITPWLERLARSIARGPVRSLVAGRDPLPQPSGYART